MHVCISRLTKHVSNPVSLAARNNQVIELSEILATIVWFPGTPFIQASCTSSSSSALSLSPFLSIYLSIDSRSRRDGPSRNFSSRFKWKFHASRFAGAARRTVVSSLNMRWLEKIASRTLELCRLSSHLAHRGSWNLYRNRNVKACVTFALAPP